MILSHLNLWYHLFFFNFYQKKNFTKKNFPKGPPLWGSKNQNFFIFFFWSKNILNKFLCLQEVMYDVTNQNRASSSPLEKNNNLMNLVVANPVFLYHVFGEFFYKSMVPQIQISQNHMSIFGAFHPLVQKLWVKLSQWDIRYIAGF